MFTKTKRLTARKKKLKLPEHGFLPCRKSTPYFAQDFPVFSVILSGLLVVTAETHKTCFRMGRFCRCKVTAETHKACSPLSLFFFRGCDF